jgi:DNA-binding CsgD family transcriptional regulator
VAHGQLRELTGFGERELLDAVREAVAAGVLAATVDGCYSFRHALVGEAARAELLPVERARLHAAVARMLEADVRGRLSHEAKAEEAPDPAALAAAAGHWEAAGRLDLAQPAHAGAADAVRVLDPRAAAAHYRRAVELSGEAPDSVLDAGWLERGASCAAAAGDHAGAVALARRALDQAGLPALQESRLTLLLAVHGSEELADDEVGAAHERAIGLAGGERSRRASPELAAALAAYGRYWLVLDRNGEALRWSSRAVQVAERADAQGELALARGTAGASGCYLGRFAEGLPQLREAVDGLERSGRPYDSARAGLTLAWAEFHAGEVDQALLTVAAQLAAVEERGGPQDIGASLAAAADEMHVWLGWWPLVDPEAHRRGRLPAVDSAGAALRRATRAELALRRGDLAAARAQYAEVLAYWESLGLGDFDLASLARLAEIAAEEGDWAAARQRIQRALPGLAETDTWVSVASLARAGVAVEAAAARAGQAPDSALAEVLQVALGRAVRAGGLPAGSLAAAECATARAELARLTGREDPQAWRAAAEAWAALGFPWWRAMAELRQAEGVLARNGSRAEGARLVERARQTAESLGAERLAAWADGLLRRGGLNGRASRSPAGPLSAVPSPRGSEPEPDAGPADGPLATLTAREHEVLGLLAEGCSNRKIAETLFISEKTASVHVSHILTKLGVASRLEAAALAHRAQGAQGAAGQP